jgi:hypothetical protein
VNHALQLLTNNKVTTKLLVLTINIKSSKMKKNSAMLLLSPLLFALFACNDPSAGKQQQTEKLATKAPAVINDKQKQQIADTQIKTADVLQDSQQLNKEFWIESKESASDLWEQTQETSAVFWGESKEASEYIWQDGKQSSEEFWVFTKQQSNDLWVDTKENSSEVWTDVKDGSEQIWLDGNEAFEQLFNENELDNTATEDNDI